MAIWRIKLKVLKHMWYSLLTKRKIKFTHLFSRLIDNNTDTSNPYFHCCYVFPQNRAIFLGNKQLWCFIPGVTPFFNCNDIDLFINLEYQVFENIESKRPSVLLFWMSLTKRARFIYIIFIMQKRLKHNVVWKYTYLKSQLFMIELLSFVNIT